MFKIIGSILKIGIFSLIVLVLAQWIHWDGRTLADQVRVGMAHAERSSVLRNSKAQIETWWEQTVGALGAKIRQAFKPEENAQKVREAKARAERRINDLLDSERAELEEVLKRPSGDR